MKCTKQWTIGWRSAGLCLLAPRGWSRCGSRSWSSTSSPSASQVLGRIHRLNGRWHEIFSISLTHPLGEWRPCRDFIQLFFGEHGAAFKGTVYKNEYMVEQYYQGLKQARLRSTVLIQVRKSNETEKYKGASPEADLTQLSCFPPSRDIWDLMPGPVLQCSLKPILRLWPHRGNSFKFEYFGKFESIFEKVSE